MTFVLTTYIITITSLITTSSIQDVPPTSLLLQKPNVILISMLLWAWVCLFFCNKNFNNKLVYSVDCDRCFVFISVVIIYLFFLADSFSIKYCKCTSQIYANFSLSLVFICHWFVNTLYLNYNNIWIYCLGQLYNPHIYSSSCDMTTLPVYWSYFLNILETY